MESLIESIRLATANDATDEARAAGAQACRTILTALDAQKGDELAVSAPTDPGASPIATAVSVLRTMQPEQLLDLAIARLKAALPEGATVPLPIPPLKFQIIGAPKLGAKR